MSIWHKSCIRFCSRCWGYSSEDNRMPDPAGSFRARGLIHEELEEALCPVSSQSGACCPFSPLGFWVSSFCCSFSCTLGLLYPSSFPFIITCPFVNIKGKKISRARELMKMRPMSHRRMFFHFSFTWLSSQRNPGAFIKLACLLFLRDSTLGLWLPKSTLTHPLALLCNSPGSSE